MTRQTQGVMLELLVFRHAKAKRETGPADHARPLTERGQRDARTMGAWLLAEGLVPDLALVSDAARTRETFELARAAFPTRLRVVSEPDLYHATEGVLLAAVQSVPPGPRRVLVCGHNPGLHDFVLALVQSGDAMTMRRLHAGFPTASVAVLQFDMDGWQEAGWRGAHLVQFVTPAFLAGRPEDDD